MKNEKGQDDRSPTSGADKRNRDRFLNGLDDPRAREYFAEIPPHLLPPEDPESPKARILEAARMLFGNKGFNGASTREIAEAADVNQAMIHYYFSNKRELYKRVIMSQLFILFRSFFSLMDDDAANLAESLSAFPVRVMTLLRERPEFRRLMIREFAEGGDTLRQLIRELGAQGPQGFRRIIHQRFAEGVRRGAVKDLPADDVIQYIISLAYSYVFLEPFFPMVVEEFDPASDAQWQRRSETFRTLLQDGLTPRESKS